LSRSSFEPTPFFLDGPVGKLFCLYFPRSAPGRARRSALVLPPFAEELNKSRRMVALAARALQRAGHDVLLIDLYGTGDSAGDFADGSLAVWRDDLACAVGWLASRGTTHLDVLAVRAGALLLPGISPPAGLANGRVALWQPVISGRTLVSQFLRLRVAAAIGDAGAARPVPDGRATLRDSGRLEVAGYDLTEQLASGLEAIDDPLADAIQWERLNWLEVVSEGATEPTPASRRALAALRERGATVDTAVVAGEPFWATPEIATVPALVDATVAALAGGGS
jgi:exosortase A-associated hydrolase 2